ncbi:MAG: hypothetical protein HY816_12385 [Candidatus Wallbacteria bacterium]|nr:hypothetical protein [Candidatus Wallbacteria bacterium]
MSRPGPGRHGRRGFVIYLVAALLGLLGMVAAFLLRDMRHRDVWTHRYSSGEVALALAQGAVSNMSFAVRHAILPEKLSGGLDAGSLYAFLLQDEETLRKKLGRVEGQSGDHTAFFKAKCGDWSLEPIERLLLKIRGARLRVFLRMAPRPLHQPSAKANEKFQDPVEKEVTLRLVASVTVGGATRTAWTDKSVRVYSVLIPLVPRFTAFALGGGSSAANEYANLPTGAPADSGDEGPTSLFHNAEPVVNDLQIQPPHQPGWLFFGTEPTVFKLTAGDQPEAGEDFHLSQSGEQPRAHEVANPPGAISSARPPDPDHPGEEQALLLQGAFWGYHAGMNFLELFGRSGEFDEKSSRLHLFGDRTNPSATKVIGPVMQGLALYTDLAIDRDATSKDESDQATGCSRPLPVRESVDPFLRHVDSEAYSSDTTREQAGQAPARLIPFNSPGQPPFNVVNQNALCDGVPVPSEVGREILRLDPLEYRYTRLFGGFEQYDPWSCREVQVPANVVPELMRLSQQESFKLLAAALLPFREGVPFQDRVVEVKGFQVAYADPVHASMPNAEGARVHFDNARVPEESMSNFAPELLAQERVVLRMSPAELIATALRGKPGGGYVLELGGRAVRVDGDLTFPPNVEVADGGLLVAGHVSFRGHFRQKNPTTRFSLVAGGVDISPGARVDGAIFSGALGRASKVLLVGSLGTGAIDQLTGWRGSRVVYDGAYDPTGPLAHEQYRISMSDTDFAGGVTYRDGAEVGAP